MKIVRLALLLAISTTASLSAHPRIAAAQSPAPSAAEPLIADVHAAPYRPKIVFTTNVGRQRFDIRNATVFEMIEFAYNLGEQDDDRENPAIIGGPTWIDFDRFDISAMLPALKPGAANSATSSQDPNLLVRATMQRVLAERFHLKHHAEDRPLPGYIVTVAKDGPKLSEAKDPTGDPTCLGQADEADPTQYTLTCTSETMAHFIAARDQDFPHPIVDHTGLTKPYDFTLKLSLGPTVHTRDDRARVFTEAFARQLGLIVARGDVPQPALVVDSVDHTPTPNAPDIAKVLPALPDLEFDVASIRLASDKEPEDQIRPSGTQITFYGFNLQSLITRAWQLPTGMMLGDALLKLPPDRFTILVKLPPGIDGRTIFKDQDQLNGMLQKLLIDRFQLKYHWGEWTQSDAYVLAAGSPKMKKANPNARTFCKFGAPEGEKPARTATSPYDTEFHCQNVTMAQFADRLQALDGGDIKNRVPNKTGLAGSYDVYLYCTGGRALRTRMAAAEVEAKKTGKLPPRPSTASPSKPPSASSSASASKSSPSPSQPSS